VSEPGIFGLPSFSFLSLKQIKSPSATLVSKEIETDFNRRRRFFFQRSWFFPKYDAKLGSFGDVIALSTLYARGFCVIVLTGYSF